MGAQRKYKVKFYIDDNYEVITYVETDEYPGYDAVEVEFQGSLADCEAYIMLTKEGYM